MHTVEAHPVGDGAPAVGLWWRCLRWGGCCALHGSRTSCAPTRRVARSFRRSAPCALQHANSRRLVGGVRDRWGVRPAWVAYRARSYKGFTHACRAGGRPLPQIKSPAFAGLFATCFSVVLSRYRGTNAAVPSGSDDAACAGPWLRSDGCARASHRTACRLLPACDRCSCRCRSACAAPSLHVE